MWGWEVQRRKHDPQMLKWREVLTGRKELSPQVRRQMYPSGSDGKESAIRMTGVQSLSWEKSPGEENGCPLQYSCLENSMDRGTWWATVHGIAKSLAQVRDEHFHFSLLIRV